MISMWPSPTYRYYHTPSW